MKTKLYAIPGTFCNKEVWDELIKNLPTNIELINIEIPQKQTINEIVDALEALLPKTPSLLMGFSFGGYLASAFALKYPQRIKKLFVVSDALDKLSDEDALGRNQFAGFIESEGFSGIGKEMVVEAVHPSRVDDIQLHENIMVMSQSMPMQAAKNQLLATTTRADILMKVAELKFSCWFLIGDVDNTFDNSNVFEIVKHKNNIKLEVIAQSGHFLPLEQPSVLADWLVNWLEE